MCLCELPKYVHVCNYYVMISHIYMTVQIIVLTRKPLSDDNLQCTTRRDVVYLIPDVPISFIMAGLL